MPRNEGKDHPELTSCTSYTDKMSTSLLFILSLFTLALVASGSRLDGARTFKLAHTTLSIHTSSYSNSQEHDSYSDAAAAAAAAASASSEEKEAISDFIFHKSKFSLHGSLSIATPASKFSIRSLGAKQEDKQFFVHFSAPCDIGTLHALHKFTGRHVIAHIDGGLYVAIGGKDFALKAREFPGVSWVQEREGSSKLSSNIQQVLKQTAAVVKEHVTPHSSSGGDRVAFVEVIAECWYDGCAAAASAVRSVCPDVYEHPTLVEVHCSSQSLDVAVSVLSEHVGVDHVDIKPVYQSFNFGGSAVLGTGSSATSPKESLVLSRINVNNSIIAVADSGIDTNNCFFYDALSSNPRHNSRVVHDFVINSCLLCGTCCSSNSGEHCSNDLNACGNFLDQSGHGTHVAGTVAGSGPDTVAYGNGIASGAKIFFQDIQNVVNLSVCYSPDQSRCSDKKSFRPPTDLLHLFGPAYNAGARVHTNSWGDSSYGFYTAQSRSVDAFVADHPTFVVLFAAGNAGMSKDLSTIGAPGTCKNCLTVGATQQSDTLFRSMQPFIDDGYFCDIDDRDPCCQSSFSCVDRCCHWAFELKMSLPCCANKPTCENAVSCDFEKENLRSATNVASFSSRGPVLDGRFKPDVVAPGQDILSAATPKTDNGRSFTSPNYCGVPSHTQSRTLIDSFNTALVLESGTSMATPLVAGAVEKIRQYFVQGYYPLGVHATGLFLEPAEALVRAVLLASCSSVYSAPSWAVLSQRSSDASNPKLAHRSLLSRSYDPEFFQGFGLPVLDHAVYMADSTNRYRMFYTNGTYLPSSPATAYTIPCNHSMAIPLTLALVWTDPPAHTNSQKQLVNDLDLIVIVPGSPSLQIFGNMRNFADSINTVERVVTQCPPAGFVTAIVASGDLLKTSSQAWYLVANGPVNTGFSPTSLPLYKNGRSQGAAAAQLQPCTTDSIDATVNFFTTRVWSCVGLASTFANLGANLDCSEMVQHFASLISQFLGVHAFTASSVSSTGITMKFQCNVLINSAGNGLSSLKYVTPMAQIVALSDAIAIRQNTHTFLLDDEVLGAFSWSTFALKKYIVNHVFFYADTPCTTPADASIFVPNPLLLRSDKCTGGFKNEEGHDMFMKPSECGSTVSVQFFRDQSCTGIITTVLRANDTCVTGSPFGLPGTGITASKQVCVFETPTLPSPTTAAPALTSPPNSASGQVSMFFYTDNTCASPLLPSFSPFVVNVNSCVMNPFATLFTSWVKFTSCSIGNGSATVFQMFTDASCSNPVTPQPISVPTSVCAFGAFVPGSLSSRFCCGSDACAPIAPSIQPNISIIVTAYADTSCGVSTLNFSGAPNPLVVSSDTCTRGPTIEGPSMVSDATYFVKAVSCGADATIALFLDASCLRFQALVNASDGICSRDDMHYGVSSLKYSCSASFITSSTVASSAPATDATDAFESHPPPSTSATGAPATDTTDAFESHPPPSTSATIKAPASGSFTAAESKNSFKLSFEIGHLCFVSLSVTRSCLINNDTAFASDIMAQCSRMQSNPESVSRSTFAVCKVVLDGAAGSNQLFLSTIHSLATLLGSDLRTLDICLESVNNLSGMKSLLHAISSTESRDPRDPTASATHLLNLCFSSCRDASTSTLLGLAAVNSASMKSKESGAGPRYCTNPSLVLLWHHAKNSPRECSDSLVASLDFGHGLTKCAMRSMLSVYIALCDAHAIKCEDSMLSLTAAELNACENVIKFNGTCSSECLTLVQRLSSDKCLESQWSIADAFAHFANATCADSGEQMCAVSSAVQRVLRSCMPYCVHASNIIQFYLRSKHQKEATGSRIHHQ